MDENKAQIEETRQRYERNVNLVGLIEDIHKLNEEKTENNDDFDDDNVIDEEMEGESETTNEEDIEKFIKSMKASAAKQLRKTLTIMCQQNLV